MPSRRRTSSSPMTMRTAPDTQPPYPAGGWVSSRRRRNSLVAAEESHQRSVRELVLAEERAGTAATDIFRPGRVRVDRGEDDPRTPREGGERLGECDPVSVRQIDVDQDR